MASKTILTPGGQGVRGLSTAKTGKTKGNPMKPKLAANIKIKQSLGGGVKQGKGGAKYVGKNSRGGKTGLTQSTVKANLVQKKAVNKLGKAPMKVQPKGPKNNKIQPKNNLTLHNKVTKADVKRTEAASAKTVHPAAISARGSKSFKNFISGN